MRVCRLYALHSELECCVGLSRYERGLLLGLCPARIRYRLYCFAVRILFFGGVGGVDSVSTCGVHGFSWGMRVGHAITLRFIPAKIY